MVRSAGEKVMFLDTSRASLTDRRTFYLYEFTIETTQGNDVLGSDLGLTVSLWQAPPVLRQEAQTSPKKLVTESDV
jgi:hypothetical protein